MESNTQILTLKDVLVGSQQRQGEINADYELRLRQLERNRSKQPVEPDTVSGFLEQRQMMEEFERIFNEDLMASRVLEFKRQLQQLVTENLKVTKFGLNSGMLSIEKSKSEIQGQDQNPSSA